MTKDKEYHVLSLSGGKDSTALAFFIRENMPEVHEKIEYIFCDTECELPETYEYLDKIEVFLDKPITRLKPYRSFEHILATQGYLPSMSHRWCTVEMKTKPFRKYINDKFLKDQKAIVNLYIGIRADEAHRAAEDRGAGSYIKATFPFVENGLNGKDINNILEKNGIGLPEYYKWSKRSGCFFCFYQNKISWLNLHEYHPDLFKKAMNYEKFYDDGSFKCGFNRDMPLKDIIKPENAEKIRDNYKKLQEKKAKKKLEKNNTFFNIDEDENTCLMCHL